MTKQNEIKIVEKQNSEQLRVRGKKNGIFPLMTQLKFLPVAQDPLNTGMH